MTRAESKKVAQSLETIAAFTGLAPEARARIERRCRWRRYEAGEPIVDYLDGSDDVYFIVSGEARASIYSLDGKAVTFSDLAPGELFGELAAIDGGPRSASIEARTECTIASMSAEASREMLLAEPAIALLLMRQLVAKVRALTTRVYEFSALAVTNRIQAEVLRLAGLAPREGKSASIAVAPTHAEIASRVSTHREAVTRELNRLSRLGIIARKGRALVVNDVDRLTAMVHEVTGE